MLRQQPMPEFSAILLRTALAVLVLLAAHATRIRVARAA